jgi:glutamate-1-semialdehyde 2,1-aminomutase
MNRRLAAASLPLQVAALSSIWTVFYTKPSRYNWMLQFYLRAAGIALSWVGTGRLIFSLDFTDDDFAAVVDRFVQACTDMQADGWWWNDGATNPSIRRNVLAETVRARWRPLATIPNQ